MAIDVSLELKGAMTAAMKADAALSALIGGKVYGQIAPASALFPYVTWGSIQSILEDVDCIDAFELFLQMHIWSRQPGDTEAIKIAKAATDVLHDASLTLTDNALVYLVLDDRRVMIDPDGLTTHAVLTFRAGVEQN